MATTLGFEKALKSAGPNHQDVYVQFTPNGASAPTIVESHGVASVTWSSTGVWVVTVAPTQPVRNLAVAEVSAVPGDSNFHELTYAINNTAKTVTITHRTCTYATIVSAGPAASNTCGTITLFVRVAQ